MGKVFWFDCETTGLDPVENTIWQLAGIIEIDGEIVDSFDLRVSPAGFKHDKVALDMAGIPVVEMMAYPPPKVFHADLCRKLAEHVDKYDKKDKFIPGGYNVTFDLEFLREMFKTCNDKYFGSWFYNAYIDVRCNVAQAVAYYNFPAQNNFKLGSLCKYLGIKLDAHEAMSDIQATRELYHSIRRLV